MHTPDLAYIYTQIICKDIYKTPSGRPIYCCNECFKENKDIKAYCLVNGKGIRLGAYWFERDKENQIVYFELK